MWGEGMICKEVWILYKKAEFFINLVLTWKDNTVYRFEGGKGL